MADVLVVEDKASLRTVLRKTVEARGYSVEEAGDAYEARRRIQASRFLVVLTDLRLPAGSGFDVLQAALDSDPATSVIVSPAPSRHARNRVVCVVCASFISNLPVETMRQRTGAPCGRPEVTVWGSPRGSSCMMGNRAALLLGVLARFNRGRCDHDGARLRTTGNDEKRSWACPPSRPVG